MIIVAIDETNLKKAIEITDCLDPSKCMIKIGSVLFNSIGQEIILHIADRGFGIFLDLKLHDIPNTVKRSIETLSKLPIKMITIHTSGGIDMMKASVEAVSGTEVKVFGVTALTSLDDNDSIEIFNRNSSEQVKSFFKLLNVRSGRTIWLRWSCMFAS